MPGVQLTLLQLCVSRMTCTARLSHHPVCGPAIIYSIFQVGITSCQCNISSCHPHTPCHKLGKQPPS